MATSNVSSKLSNLNLGKDNNETERPKHFWTKLRWPWSLVLSLSGDWCSMEGQTETKFRNAKFGSCSWRCSLKLEITGPLIDSYLKEIGRAFSVKLGRSKCTGLMPPIKVFIPYNILRHLCTMCVGYGADMTCEENKKIALEVNTLDTASKVSSPVRFKGDNYVWKCHYVKIKQDGRNF